MSDFIEFDGVVVEKSQVPVTTETDPTGRSPHEPGAKTDKGKVDYTLIPHEFLEGIARMCEDEEVRSGLSLMPLNSLGWKARLFARGAKKYSPNGWKEVPGGRARYIKAAYRHLVAHLRGEFLDKETKAPHLTSLSWNADAVLYFFENNLE